MLLEEILLNVFSISKDITQAQNKINIELAKTFMIVCLKHIWKECFLFNDNFNASLKFFWALGGLSEDAQALEHSEGTCALGYLEGTWTLDHLGH